jgi:hypothetical protein
MAACKAAAAAKVGRGSFSHTLRAPHMYPLALCSPSPRSQRTIHLSIHPCSCGPFPRDSHTACPALLTRSNRTRRASRSTSTSPTSRVTPRSSCPSR